MTEYEGVVEIIQCHGVPETNDYLDAGYMLLRIVELSYSGRHPQLPPGNQAGSYFVGRRVNYVVGRTALVAHREPTPTTAAYQPPKEG